MFIKHLRIFSLCVIVLMSTACTKSDHKPTLFYSLSCPHCQEVRAFLEEHKDNKNLVVEQKEISQNPYNKKELILVLQQCNPTIKHVDLPVLWADAKCFMGAAEIISFFKEKLNGPQ